MRKRLLLDILFEVIWFAIAAIAGVLIAAPFKADISEEFYLYLVVSIFLIITYFRFVIFTFHSILLRSVWVKIGLLILNVPLFFFVLNRYFAFIATFDEYNYSLAATVFQHIHTGTDLNEMLNLRSLTAFCGFTSMIVIILLEMRLVYSIFKLRQLDKFL